MPVYRYQAVDSGGELLKEQMEAPSEEAVIARLRERNLLPIAVEQAGAVSFSGPVLSWRRRVSRKDVAVLTQQLASLLNAGLPLDRALSVLIGISEEGEIKKLLTRVQDQVRGGASLADALEAQSGAFSRFYLNMVRAGEAGGSVEAVLVRLTEFLERSQALRESVTSALIYPAILVFVAGLSVVILLAFVVPQFQQLFADAGEALPLATQVVIATGDVFRSYWWAGLLMVLVLIALVRRRLARPEHRYRWDGWVLKMPLVGDLVAKVEMARFARSLGTLLGNGVALLTALAIVREIMTNQVMAGALNDVADDLKAGRGLAQPLMEAGIFPGLAVHMIQVGEETGQLQEMLLQVADTYDREVQATVKRLLALMEPALILGLGVIIAGIIMSILVAILGLNELAF